jgi:hypothetical protein
VHAVDVNDPTSIPVKSSVIFGAVVKVMKFASGGEIVVPGV